jgi:uncharacterized repeat protein (TIGR03803 family)
MKSWIKKSFVVPLVVAVLGMESSAQVTSLISSGDILYGTTERDGTGGDGTVFKFNADGTGFSTLHNFAQSSPNSAFIYTNYDGANPYRRLVLSGNTLYGVAWEGGSFGNGTVFKVNTDGTGFSILHTGTGPMGELALSGNTLFWTTYRTVFAVNTDGSGFTNLFDFMGSSDETLATGLVASSNSLYGATFSSKVITDSIFRLNSDGTGWTTLWSGGSVGPLLIGWSFSGIDSLILSGNTLYGTAYSSPESGFGGGGIGCPTPNLPYVNIFKLNTDGTGYSAGGGGDGLVVAHETLYYSVIYSTPTWCGNGGPGSGPPIVSRDLIASNADGTGSQELDRVYLGTTAELYSPTDVAVSGNKVFWIANGTIRSLTLTPRLTITPSASNIILTWPTNYAGFDYSGYNLQSTSNLDSPVWTSNFPAPLVLNGQESVTVPVTGTQQFFRLRQ